MPVSRGLQLAMEKAERQRDQAARMLAQIRQRELQAIGQLNQLEAYLAEKDQVWIGRSGQLNPAVMEHHYSFLSKLDSAIGLQRGVMARFQAETKAAAQAVMACEQRLSALRQAAAGIVAADQQALLKREQKQMDEMAGQMHQRLRSASTEGEPR